MDIKAQIQKKIDYFWQEWDDSEEHLAPQTITEITQLLEGCAILKTHKYRVQFWLEDTNTVMVVDAISCEHAMEVPYEMYEGRWVDVMEAREVESD